MPAKRTPDARKGGSHKAASRQAQPGGLANDLIGIGIIVLALAMAVSVLMPSQAPVTHAMAEGLRLGFGEGALLVPVAMFLFALTLFLPTDRLALGRVAGGLGLVVLAILSLISIMLPGAEESPASVLEASSVVVSGGYVGSAFAWVLLTYTGKVVGIVLLAGLGLAGAVVCGFSVSDFVLRLRGSVASAAERIADSRERRASQRAASLDEASDEAWVAGGAADDETVVLDEPKTQVASPSAQPRTSFIGARKGSVLRRRGKEKDAPSVDHKTATLPIEGLSGGAVAPEPATSLLRRRLRTRRGHDDAASSPEAPAAVPEPAEAAPGHDAGAVPEPSATASVEPLPFVPDEPAGGSAPSVPDFLKVAAGRPSASTEPAPKASKPRPGRGSRAAAKAAPAELSRPGDGSDSFELPPLSLLMSNPNSASSATSDSELERTARRLQSTLEEFGLTSRVGGWTAGPLVTTFKIEMGEGERVNKITNLQDDIQLSLASESVRIFAPIPGTSLVGIEIPNKRRQNVCLGDVLPYAQGGPLEFAIGRDSEGAPVVADLARMPHMLVAGTTGSGKSVLINAIIMSLIMRTTPEQVRLILVDPKRVEFSCYAGLPHLYVPVVTEPRQAASALQWAVTEMDRRLKVFERAGARDVKVYNKMVDEGKFADQENPPKPMPYLVIVIDELSDLMMVAGKDVEASIVRIAQLARAAGIHLVLATQRPSADVVTGLIKSNVDTRVALKVSSSIDSRVILDQTGAERLMGRGDMLFRKAGGVLRRVLGAYASDAEIESVVSFIRDQREPDYHDEILSAVVPGQAAGAGGASDASEEDDPLVWEAAQVVVDSQLGSTSGLQRRLKVGYARAGRIMDMLEQKGVVGPPDGSKPREVLLDAEGLEELRVADAAYREV